MNELGFDVGELIASFLLDELDAACLRASGRLWRTVYRRSTLWTTLVEQRFGRELVPQDTALSEATFKRLAKLRKPVVDGSVIWLDGNYLAGEVTPRFLCSVRVRWAGLRVPTRTRQVSHE
jgi:hypothetical protein